MCKDAEVFADMPLLARASVEERIAATTALLDYMRKGLAVETDALDQTAIEALARRMWTTVKVPWAITDDQLQGATTLVTHPPRRADIRPRDEPLLLRGSSRSTIGREVRSMHFGGALPQANEVEAVIQGLLDACKRYGLLTALPAPVGGEGWRINANVVVFKTGPGSGEIDRRNDFFAALYLRQLPGNGGASNRFGPGQKMPMFDIRAFAGLSRPDRRPGIGPRPRIFHVSG